MKPWLVVKKQLKADEIAIVLRSVREDAQLVGTASRTSKFSDETFLDISTALALYFHREDVEFPVDAFINATFGRG